LALFTVQNVANTPLRCADGQTQPIRKSDKVSSNVLLDVIYSECLTLA